MSLRFGSNPVIIIDLQPGIYLLPEESSSGKSFMSRRLKTLESVDRATSHTFPAEMDSKKVLDSSLRDVVVLDRYDMCSNDYSEDMLNFSKDGVLLVDCKSHSFNLPCRSCRMYMTESELFVK